MHQLIDRIFVPHFRNPILATQHDGALLEIDGLRLAMTTDSYVVQPLFFPGGDIGSLAVHGTVNDLAMCGARARWISTGFILEEGLDLTTLERIVDSMARAAAACGVQIVTGDTKVLERARGDGLYINTAGVGMIETDQRIAPDQVQPGDQILLSGDIGRHGIAIMSVREGLEFASPILSDSAPLIDAVQALLQAGITVHCLRDLTRGGLATALNEIANQAQVQIRVRESAIPIEEAVQGACEILGLDPLYVANEGRFIAFVPADQAEPALEVLRSVPVSQGACLIGEVKSRASHPEVILESLIGGERVLDLLSGEQLPRIC